jgi:hypothetical protein
MCGKWYLSYNLLTYLPTNKQTNRLSHAILFATRIQGIQGKNIVISPLCQAPRRVNTYLFNDNENISDNIIYLEREKESEIETKLISLKIQLPL